MNLILLECSDSLNLDPPIYGFGTTDTSSRSDLGDTPGYTCTKLRSSIVVPFEFSMAAYPSGSAHLFGLEKFVSILV